MTREQIKQVIQKKCIEAFKKAVVPWDLDSIAAAIETNSYKYHVSAKLALCQGILECHFGCNPVASRSRKTRNIYNVGNTDDGSNMFYATYEAGIERYFRLMAREYCWRSEGNVVTVEMMLKHRFQRPRGGYYASAKNYTETIRGIGEAIDKLLPQMGTNACGTQMNTNERLKGKDLAAVDVTTAPVVADKTAVKSDKSLAKTKGKK